MLGRFKTFRISKYKQYLYWKFKTNLNDFTFFHNFHKIHHTLVGEETHSPS